MLNDWLFAAPWWEPTLLIAVAIGVLWAANRRQDKQIFYIGTAIFIVGVAIALISFLVDTDVEMVEKRTRQLVAAVDHRDWKAFELLLDPKTGFAFYHNRDELVAGAKRTTEAVNFRNVTITSLEAQKIDTLITVDIDVWAQADQTMGRPFPTSWRLSWQNLGNGWFLYRVEALPNSTVTPDLIHQRLVR